jgi:tripartite-type tricarboxylate transporter receptor subunit TctC
MRRVLLVSFGSLCLPHAAVAQDTYPSRVVRIVVPTAAGGGGDTLARMIAQGLSERWGRQVITENRTGASTMIGGEIVAKAAPDGHTLLQGLATLATNPATSKHVPYDALRDFAPIIQLISIPNIVLAHPSVPVKSAREMIAFAKARPDQIFYASAGTGTSTHLALELFCTMGNVRMVHVPYRSAGPAMTALLGGEAAMLATNMIYGLPYARSGKLRALGVTSPKRVPVAPDIPTIAESGLAGYEAEQWYGLLAPAGTPRDVINKIYKDAAAIVTSPEVRERLGRDGGIAVASVPEAFAAFIRAETVKWAKVAKAAGIKPE